MSASQVLHAPTY